MELVPYLRSRIMAVRDGYDTTPAARKRLYAFLKTNSGWRVESVPHKLGRRNYEWLVGLEQYGDEQGWYDEAIALASREV